MLITDDIVVIIIVYIYLNYHVYITATNKTIKTWRSMQSYTLMTLRLFPDYTNKRHHFFPIPGSMINFPN